jgi:hypothetical protein
MRLSIILLALAAAACSKPARQADPGNASADRNAQVASTEGDMRAQFLHLAGKDSWADWPADLLEDPDFYGRACVRVSAPMRPEAIRLLDQQPAVALEAVQYRRLVGNARPPGGGTPYLLRGFSSPNSTSLIKRAGSAIVVHTNSPDSLSKIRRDPCVAILNAAPTRVFTVATADP